MCHLTIPGNRPSGKIPDNVLFSSSSERSPVVASGLWVGKGKIFGVLLPVDNLPPPTPSNEQLCAPLVGVGR